MAHKGTPNLDAWVEATRKRVADCKHEHVHEVQERAYTGGVNARDENRAAHGNIEVTERCGTCSGERRRLVNGRHEEIGDWEAPIEWIVYHGGSTFGMGRWSGPHPTFGAALGSARHLIRVQGGAAPIITARCGSAEDSVRVHSVWDGKELRVWAEDCAE